MTDFKNQQPLSNDHPMKRAWADFKALHAELTNLQSNLNSQEPRTPYEAIIWLKERSKALLTALEMAQLAEAKELNERLKREAQGHAQASRTSSATLNEIYQLCSDGKGEKADWNGAEPVRQKLNALQEQLAAKERELEHYRKLWAVAQDERFR